MKSYKCSVCNIFPTGSVYTCTIGHPICGECRPTIRKCHRLHCNKTIAPGRNIELENRINSGRFSCLHRIYGCRKMLKLFEYENHILICKFRPYCCPGCKLHVPVSPTQFKNDDKIEDEENNNNNNEDTTKKHLIHGDDPWLSWEKPETIQGISLDETVTMKPTPTMGRPTASVSYLFREGNIFNSLIKIGSKRKNKKNILI